MTTEKRKSIPLERTKTPGIYKRGKRYVVVFRDPTGKQRKAFARTLAEARDLKAGLTSDVSRGEYRELSRATLAEYASRWIETYTGRTRRGIGDNTRADYCGSLERDIVPELGRLRLAEIEPGHVKDLAKKLGDRGLAPASVAKTIAPLKALLATAVEERLIRSNPAAGVRLAQPDQDAIDTGDDVRALSDEEAARLLEEIPKDWRFFFSFLAETGSRISEAIEFRHGDVVGEWLAVDRQHYRGRVTRPKGRKKRRVRLSAPMARALWVRQRGKKASDLLFTSERGQRVTPSNLMSRTLKPAAVRAGLGEWINDGKGGRRAESWVGFHTFRHTCATRLFRGGWNAKQVATFLGHTDAAFTLRTYVHLLPEDMPQPDFGGNGWATEATETGRNDELAEAVEMALTAAIAD